MQKRFIQLTLHILIFHYSYFTAAETTCSDSQRHHVKLCFSPPQPIVPVDWKWSIENEPSGGWYIVLGNDIIRLHLAEAIRGELLSLRDNYDHVCARSKILRNNGSNAGGTFFGYRNLTSTWNCNNSYDFPGLILCDDVSSAPTKYRENFNYYKIYSNKNFQMGVVCFPNGEVGWMTFSRTKSFTETEKKIIIDQITNLGFSEDTIVTLYDESKCSND